MYAAAKIGFMQYVLEKRKERKPQWDEGSCRIGLENEGMP